MSKLIQKTYTSAIGFAELHFTQTIPFKLIVAKEKVLPTRKEKRKARKPNGSNTQLEVR